MSPHLTPVFDRTEAHAAQQDHQGQREATKTGAKTRGLHGLHVNGSKGNGEARRMHYRIRQGVYKI